MREVRSRTVGLRLKRTFEDLDLGELLMARFLLRRSLDSLSLMEVRLGSFLAPPLAALGRLSGIAKRTCLSCEHERGLPAGFKIGLRGDFGVKDACSCDKFGASASTIIATRGILAAR